MIVDCRDYSQDKAELARLESFWRSYKSKPFLMIGSHRGASAAAVRANLKAAGVTFPVYADAVYDPSMFEPKNGLIYVINQGGATVIKTTDINIAYENAITALSWGAMPSDVDQYRLLIDYELGVLPGKAYLHILKMRKAFPAQAGSYSEALKKLSADPSVRKVAELEELTRRVKDFDSNAKHNGKTAKISARKLKEKVEEASTLKDSDNPLVVQEAKNCIADLQWAISEIE